MKSQPQADEKALNPRSAFVALCMVLLWTLGCCLMAVSLGTQQLLMVLGFGAILTIFLLQFPRLFLVSVFLIWAGTGAFMLLSGTPGDHKWMLPGLLRSLAVVAPVMGLAYWLHRRRLKKGELVVVYACVVIAIPWCVCIKAVMESSVANLFELQRESEPQLYAWARELPWWAPTIKPPPRRTTQPATAAAARELSEDERITRDAVARFTRGHPGPLPWPRFWSIVPWRLWWRPMVYWAAMCLAFEGMLMGLLLMFRKRFIEHERLPLVWAQPAVSLIRGPQPGENTRRRWIMFAIGLGLCMPALVYTSPTGEALSSWTCPPWAGDEGQQGIRGGLDLTGLNLLPGTPLKLFWGPLVLAMFLLFPVDVLMTVALTHILLAILLPGLMRAFGISVGPTLLAGFVKNGLRFGGAVGLLVWSIFFNARTIWGYIRSLWGGKATDACSDDELPRPLVLLIFVGGLVGFIALGCYATTSSRPGLSSYYGHYSGIIQMVVLTLLILIFSFSQIRQRIEGLPLAYDNNFGSHQMVSIQRGFMNDHYGLAARDPNIPITGHSWAIHWFQWGFNGQLKSFGPHNMLLEAFKVGHEFRVHARQIAKAILMTMLVVALITPVLYIWLMHVYGFENSYQGPLTTWAAFTQWSERAASYGIHSTSATFKARAETLGFYDRYKSLFHISYGVVIIGLLFHLRREYPRFPFSPVGVVIAAEYWSGGYGMPFSADQVWFSFLLAWMVKALIFRWVGVKSFREKVAPAVIMLLCGLIFGMMVYMFRHIALLRGCLK